MAADHNGVARPAALASLSNLVSPETLQQWIDMNPPPPQLVEDAAMCEEAKHWLPFASSFGESKDWKNKLQCLDAHLLKKSVVCGSGIAISPVDIAVFLAIRDTVVTDVIPSIQDQFPNVVRWFDYVQGVDQVASTFHAVPIRKSKFEPQDFSDTPAKRPAKLDQKVAMAENVPSTDAVSVVKEIAKQQELKPKKAEAKSSDSSSKVEGNKEEDAKAGVPSKEEKKGKKVKIAAPAKEERKTDDEVSVSVLDIRVGLIVKVWKHPSADALFVEEIDLGESSVRQVVSGLARYLKEEDLLNRKVVLIANVKPGKLRDVVSAGLVLCASNSDHSAVEPLIVPDGAAVGEKIAFAGIEGKPEEVLNPKKKQLEKVFPDLSTDENGVATYKGIPFMTSAGPCNSTLVKAAIK